MHIDPYPNTSTRIYDFLSKVFNDAWTIVKITFCFVVFSLPIITVFAAFGAAVRCLVKLDQNYELNVSHDFLEFFKSDFWRSTLVGFSCLLTMLACIVSGTYYYLLINGSVFQNLSILLFTSLFAFSFLFCFAYYTVRSSVDVPFFDCLKNSACLLFLSVVADIGLLIVLIMLLILVYLKQSLLLILPLLWILYTRLCVFSYGKQIQKYMIQDK